MPARDESALNASGRRRARLLGAAMLIAVATAVPAGAGGAATSTRVSVRVPSRRAFTATGISLRAGQTVTIKASGRIHFGGGRISAMTPAGLPWGTGCTQIARGQARTAAWPAPGSRCWSLLGKVGSAPAFEVGVAKTFQVTGPGELSLGVNDNFVADNAGAWQATVTLSAPAPAPSSKHSGSSSLIVGVVGALLVAVLVLGGVWWMAGRKRRRATTAPPRAEPAEPMLVSAPGSRMAAANAATGATAGTLMGDRDPSGVSSPDPEPDRANIFETEFSNGLTLRIGYRDFPEECEIQWRVSQDRVVVASGEFLAKGGEHVEHFQTVPLGTKLEGRATQPNGADAQFDWTINDQPYRHSVRRDANC